jgi:hypothetical protein
MPPDGKKEWKIFGLGYRSRFLDPGRLSLPGNGLQSLGFFGKKGLCDH